MQQDNLFNVGGERPKLRPYQREAIDKMETLVAQGVRAALIVAPTGAGKTVIAADIVYRNKDKRLLFLAPRRELIHQT